MRAIAWSHVSGEKPLYDGGSAKRAKLKQGQVAVEQGTHYPIGRTLGIFLFPRAVLTIFNVLETQAASAWEDVGDLPSPLGFADSGMHIREAIEGMINTVIGALAVTPFALKNTRFWPREQCEGRVVHRRSVVGRPTCTHKRQGNKGKFVGRQRRNAMAPTTLFCSHTYSQKASQDGIP